MPDRPTTPAPDRPAAVPARAETPIRRQWQTLKQQHPDCLLLFQLGDFFESFEEDARIVSRVCGIVLTSREFGKGDRVPLAGVPLGRLETHLTRLMDAGYHVAVAEQMTPPGAGLVERAITRVVTPGTVAEPGLLRERENRYLASLARGRGAVGLAYVDVSTGEFAVTQLEGPDAEQRLRAELERLGPAELLLAEGEAPPEDCRAHVTPCRPATFGEARSRERLLRQLAVASLAGFGCERLPLAISAAGALLVYLDEHDPRLLRGLASLRTYQAGRGMLLDQATRRSLELTRGSASGRMEGSLLATLDRCRTAMGGRLLRAWLGEPLLSPATIEQRLDAVQAFVQDDRLRASVRVALDRVGDLERRLARLGLGVSTPREMLALAEALRAAGDVQRLFSSGVPAGLATLVEALDSCPHVVDLVERAVAPPGSGRTVQPGFDAALDALVQTMSSGRQQAAQLEQAERQRTGIRSLKVGFNRVFGYYLEVSKANLGLVPAEYQRKQTLVSAERFVTPTLKQLERRILHAEEQVAETERAVYEGVLSSVAAELPRLRRVAQALAHLDALAGLADLAAERGYCRPHVTDDTSLRIHGGRHPVVEQRLEVGGFIANDCHLTTTHQQVLVLTGPNMAGKSTYLRQVALIVLMAQIGSFVPARSAAIGLVDRVFTRVGAQDDIAGGASTFMVEMTEAAAILRHATSRSLVVLDEVGRGTSTYDGMAIARAIVEDLHDRVGARTLFATHFHELSALAESLPRVQAFHTAVAEESGQIVFLRRVEPGPADRSYGVHVARLAGLPVGVTLRAEQILRELEGGTVLPFELLRLRDEDRAQLRVAEPPAGYDAYLPPPEDNLLAEVLSLDVATTTPLEALNRIAQIQQRARTRARTA